jgi:DHA2 family multidrug resistance protein
VSKIDPRKLATVAFLGFGFVLWMRSHFTAQVQFSDVLIPTVLQGAAMAFFFIPLQAIVFSGLSPARMPAAAGLSNFVRITAGAFGTSLITTLWEDRAVMHHAHLAETINQGNQTATATLGQLSASGMPGDQALAMVNRLIDQQAYTLAATDLFYLSSVLFLLLIGLVWMTRPKKGAHMGDAGGAH